MNHDEARTRLLAERTEVAELLAGAESEGQRGPRNGGRGGNR